MLRPSLKAIALALACTVAHAQVGPLKLDKSRPLTWPRDQEITVPSRHGPGVVWVYSTFSGALLGEELERDVTVRYLKLANGQLLFDYARQSPDFREINTRFCERQGRVPPPGNPTSILSGTGVGPGFYCFRGKIDHQPSEENIGNDLRNRREGAAPPRPEDVQTTPTGS